MIFQTFYARPAECLAARYFKHVRTAAKSDTAFYFSWHCGLNFVRIQFQCITPFKGSGALMMTGKGNVSSMKHHLTVIIFLRSLLHYCILLWCIAMSCAALHDSVLKVHTKNIPFLTELHRFTAHCKTTRDIGSLRQTPQLQSTRIFCLRSSSH